MEENRLFVVLFLISVTTMAQVKGVVVDEKNTPIPYVNILVENENSYTNSEENGQFQIGVSDQSKVLIFSSLGFETKKIKASEAERVVMKAVPIELREIQIEKPSASIINEIDKFDKDKVHFYYGLATNQYSLAKFFAFNDTIKKTPFLKSIIIHTKAYNKTSSIRVRVMAADENGNPIRYTDQGRAAEAGLDPGTSGRSCRHYRSHGCAN